MNPVFQCILLVACVVICNSTPIKRCQCLKTCKYVRPSLIADVKEFSPRPYCKNHEVIVTLKDKSSRCLDPEGDFTKKLLQHMEEQRKSKMMIKSDKGSTITPDTTTVPPTASPTASAAASASTRAFTTVVSTSP